MQRPNPESRTETRPPVYAEAVSRLAGVRHALRLIDDGFADGPQDDEAIASAWDQAGEARQRLFDRRSGKLVGAAAAGVEALMAEQQEGREPHEAAAQALVDQIRRELADVAGIVAR
jgi:hypothetical protein